MISRWHSINYLGGVAISIEHGREWGDVKIWLQHETVAATSCMPYIQPSAQLNIWSSGLVTICALASTSTLWPLWQAIAFHLWTMTRYGQNRVLLMFEMVDQIGNPLAV